MNGLYDRLHVNVSCHLRDYVFFDSMLEMHKRLLSSTSIPMGTKSKKRINFCFFIFKEMRLVEYSVCLVVIGYVLGRVCKEKKIKENNMEKKKSNLLPKSNFNNVLIERTVTFFLMFAIVLILFVFVFI